MISSQSQADEAVGRRRQSPQLSRILQGYDPRMREERVVIGDVPARLYVPPGADGLLLLGHGGGESKDGHRFVELARRYAQEVGLAVVCIDAVRIAISMPASTTGRSTSSSLSSSGGETGLNPPSG